MGWEHAYACITVATAIKMRTVCICIRSFRILRHVPSRIVPSIYVCVLAVETGSALEACSGRTRKRQDNFLISIGCLTFV